MELSPEERQRIYEEEKARREARVALDREAKGQSWRKGAIGCLGIVSIFFFIGIIGTCVSVLKQSHIKNEPRSEVHDDLSQFLSRYALPDSDDTTAYDEPRPPIVTRWLVYRRERVRVMYVADGEVGQAPPYRGWRFLAFQDSESDEVLSAAEASRRLRLRRTQ